MIANELFVQHEAEYKASVMYATFGHLDAKPNTSFDGSFIFAIGQYGDLTVVTSEFGADEPCGPAFYNDINEFVWQQDVKNNHKVCGVFKFIGRYTIYKKYNPKGYGYFRGKVTKIA